MVEAFQVFHFFSLFSEGLLSGFSSTAFLYHFRTREELDRYLEASQIRERAIERVTNVVGTYGQNVFYLIFLLSLAFLLVPLLIFVLTLILIFCQVYYLLIYEINIFFSCHLCRYNDLRLRIFSKHPDLFPEEV